jgi:hypothetical protein
MTSAKGRMLSQSNRNPFGYERIKWAPRKQLAIIFVAAVVLIVSSCARLGGTFQNHDTPLPIKSAVLFGGLTAIPVAIACAVVVLILKLFRKRGMQP